MVTQFICTYANILNNCIYKVACAQKDDYLNMEFSNWTPTTPPAWLDELNAENKIKLKSLHFIGMFPVKPHITMVRPNSKNLLVDRVLFQGCKIYQDDFDSIVELVIGCEIKEIAFDNTAIENQVMLKNKINAATDAAKISRVKIIFKENKPNNLGQPAAMQQEGFGIPGMPQGMQGMAGMPGMPGGGAYGKKGDAVIESALNRVRDMDEDNNTRKSFESYIDNYMKGKIDNSTEKSKIYMRVNVVERLPDGNIQKIKDRFAAIPYEKVSADLNKILATVEGSTEAKRRFYNIFLGILKGDLNAVPKSSLIFLGDPGTGKTLFVEVIGKLCYYADCADVNEVLTSQVFREYYGIISLTQIRDIADLGGTSAKFANSNIGLILSKLSNSSKKRGLFVLLFDEVDKGSRAHGTDEASNFLLKLTDMGKTEFLDSNMDPILVDCKNYFFVFSANEKGKVPITLLSRLDDVWFKGFNPAEKFAILKNSEIVKDVSNYLQFDDEILRMLVQSYGLTETGVRCLLKSTASLINNLTATEKDIRETYEKYIFKKQFKPIVITKQNYKKYEAFDNLDSFMQRSVSENTDYGMSYCVIFTERNEVMPIFVGKYSTTFKSDRGLFTFDGNGVKIKENERNTMHFHDDFSSDMAAIVESLLKKDDNGAQVSAPDSRAIYAALKKLAQSFHLRVELYPQFPYNDAGAVRANSLVAAVSTIMNKKVKKNAIVLGSLNIQGKLSWYPDDARGDGESFWAKITAATNYGIKTIVLSKDYESRLKVLQKRYPEVKFVFVEDSIDMIRNMLAEPIVAAAADE